MQATIRILIPVIATLLGAVSETRAAAQIAPGDAVNNLRAAGGLTAPDLPAVNRQRLGNGIRVTHLPELRTAPGDYTEITFGYVPAGLNGSGNSSGVARLFTSYLSLSIAARSVALAAHLAGGEFEFLDVPDRVGMKVRVPVGTVGDIVEQIADYFSHVIINFDVLEHARAAALESDARAPAPGPTSEITVEVEAALFDRLPLGPDPEAESSLTEVQGYFDTYVGTDRAYVISSRPLEADAIALLAAVASRGSTYEVASEGNTSTQVELRFPSRPDGGVIIATAVPSPRYESWFSALIVDRLLKRGAAPDVTFDFQVSTGESMHRIESPVRLPDYAEDARDEWINRIQGVLFESLRPAELDQLKNEVFGQLSERPMLEWFAAHDLWDALTAGWNMLRGLTPDELRSRALAFAGARRVIGLWSPAFGQPEVLVQDLAAVGPDIVETAEPEVRVVPGRVRVPPSSQEESVLRPPVRLERLRSGVTLAESGSHMIFISGGVPGELAGGLALKSGASGVLWAFPGEPTDDALGQLDGVRADRLLIFAPTADLPAARARFENWASGTTDSSPTVLVGEVATADVPGLIVLKTWLDAKIIEAGWWGRVDLRIDGIEGSKLVIDGDAERETLVRSWIAELAREGIADADFERVRNAAGGYFERIRRELQIILWQRAPEGTIPPPSEFTLTELRKVAEAYF